MATITTTDVANFRWLRLLLPRSLLGRSVMIIVTPLILLQVVTTSVFYETHWDTVTRRLARSVAGDIATVIDMMGTDPTAAGRERLFDVARDNMQLDISFVSGARLPDVPSPLRETLVDRNLAEALTEFVQRPFLTDTRSLETSVEIHVQLDDGVLRVMAPRRRLFSSTTYIVILWMVGTSLALLAIATIFMRNQVRPIRRLATAADEFGKGRDSDDFRIEGASEVRQAAAAFNLMRDRIRRQLSQRTEMLAGVSHDLRTPLTRMKLALAMMGEGPDVADLKGDVSEMERMVGGYLAFAKGEGREPAVEIDLGELLQEVVGAALREGANIELDAEEDLRLTLRPEAMRRCLTNLIGNAQRHAKTIWVVAAYRGDAVEITIDDDGTGIPPDKREEVFRPFYRLDSSRNPATGGIGLGLTIARDVMRSHGGELTLSDSPQGGLRASLRLPV
jgi:two-component system osmolarity sensor histidine kinase EnvZ